MWSIGAAQASWGDLGDVAAHGGGVGAFVGAPPPVQGQFGEAAVPRHLVSHETAGAGSLIWLTSAVPREVQDPPSLVYLA